MRRISNLEGDVMWEDVPEIKFCIRQGEVQICEILGENLPLEFEYLPLENALLEFLDDRAVPETRIGLQKDLDIAGIPYFNMDAILKYSNGFSVEDHYWLRFQEGVQSWEELLYHKFHHMGGIKGLFELPK